jgi:methylated-DNA-[protein]-cysteine S-methyltransferase
MITRGLRVLVMAGRGYAVFDTAIGRCCIVWGDAGISTVQLPEAREIETRRRLFRFFPDARELRPPAHVETAIEGIAAALRGQDHDFSDAALDMSGISKFNQSVYAYARSIPRGETRSTHEVATALRASGAVHSVAQALAKNPFMIIVPCHRVLESAGAAERASQNGGVITRRRLLGIEGTRLSQGKTLLDVLLPLDPPRPRP